MCGVRAMKRAAACAVVMLCAGCAASGTVTPGAAASGPVQDIHLIGANALYWSSAADPAGVHTTPPGPAAATGCYAWSDASGMPHWAARILGEAGGHSVELDLSVAAQSLQPLGTHTTTGAVSTDGVAVLDVGGTAYPAVHVDPSDAMPSYFTIDHDSTTGLISVRFAASATAPQAYLVTGRWACA